MNNNEENNMVKVVITNIDIDFMTIIFIVFKILIAIFIVSFSITTVCFIFAWIITSVNPVVVMWQPIIKVNGLKFSNSKAF